MDEDDIFGDDFGEGFEPDVEVVDSFEDVYDAAFEDVESSYDGVRSGSRDRRNPLNSSVLRSDDLDFVMSEFQD